MQKKTRYVIGISIVLCAVVLLVASGMGYRRTLDIYFKAYERNDAELLCTVTPQYWIDWCEKGIGPAEAELGSRIHSSIIRWGCGDNAKVSYRITDSRRANKDELQELEQDIFEHTAYYVYKRNEFSITDAYVVDLEVTVSGDEGTRELDYSDGVLLVKEKGRWKVSRGIVNCSFYSNQ